jgi:small GTP-binding protein
MEKGSSVQNRLTVLVIGSQLSGKTALLNQFIHGLFSECHLVTIGVDYLTCTRQVNGETIKYAFWDCSGRREYADLVKRYFHPAGVALIVFDLTTRDSFLEAQDWYQQLKEGSGLVDEQIVLTGNKSDLPNREVTMEEIEQFCLPKGLAYFEASALDSERCFVPFHHLARVGLYFTPKTDSHPPRESPPRSGPAILRSMASFFGALLEPLGSIS